MLPLRQYDIVRVRKLLHHAEHYNGWGVNQRAPSIGDTGTIVEILSAAGVADAYVVECSDADGVTIWLGDFAAEEIESLGDARSAAEPHYSDPGTRNGQP